MKRLQLTIALLVLVLLAPVRTVWAETPPAAGALPIEALPGFQGLNMRNISQGSATVRFKISASVSGSLAYGTDTQYGSVVEIPALDQKTANHDVSLTGLQAGTSYHVRLSLTDGNGQVYQSSDLEFKTPGPAAPPAAPSASTKRPREENVASPAASAHIRGVSSTLNDGDNSSEFGALKAIDGLDDSAWQSNGDGNQAWIEIGLAKKFDINAIGFRSTKAPDGTGQTFRFTVTTDGGQTVGLFELPDADHIYYFPVEITAHTLRFSLVDTSGGNTGAVAIEAFRTSTQ